MNNICIVGEIFTVCKTSCYFQATVEPYTNWELYCKTGFYSTLSGQILSTKNNPDLKFAVNRSIN